MSETQEYLAIFAAAVFLLALFAIPAIWVVQHQCHSQARLASTVTDSRWGVINGCFWKVDGEWIPADRYRTVSQ